MFKKIMYSIGITFFALGMVIACTFKSEDVITIMGFIGAVGLAMTLSTFITEGI